MARIRSIKPEFVTDGKIDRLSDSAALFFVLLWTHCDDSGFFTLDVRELALKLPRWRAQAIQSMIWTLARVGLVKISRGSGVGLVEGWRHQRIDKPRPSAWDGVEIQWDDALQFQERSQNDRRKDRIGSDRRGSDQLALEVQAPPSATVTQLPVSKAPRAKKPPKEPSATTRVWEAYKAAYTRRWGAEPTKNARVMGQLAQFVSRVPADEAPAIAEFYVGHPFWRFVQDKHPVGSLLYNAEKLRTEWQTGHAMTGSEAKQLESRSRNAQIFGEIFGQGQTTDRSGGPLEPEYRNLEEPSEPGHD